VTTKMAVPIFTGLAGRFSYGSVEAKYYTCA